ncbi:MAG: GntR family transcriptional regulator, partial [Gemmatimonadaceae bacterium]
MSKQPIGAIIPPLTSAGDGASRPLYLQIYRRVRSAVLAGALAPGSRLPSARTFASDLGVSRNTVESAFSQLEAEGFVERRVGSGSYVARTVPDQLRRPRGGPAHQPPRPPRMDTSALSARGRLVAAAGASMDAGSGRAFAPCQPGLDSFPLALWRRLTARRLRLSGDELLGAADPGGYRPLREAVAEHLGAARG